MFLPCRVPLSFMINVSCIFILSKEAPFIVKKIQALQVHQVMLWALAVAQGLKASVCLWPTLHSTCSVLSQWDHKVLPEWKGKAWLRRVNPREGQGQAQNLCSARKKPNKVDKPQAKQRHTLHTQCVATVHSRASHVPCKWQWHGHHRPVPGTSPGGHHHSLCPSQQSPCIAFYPNQHKISKFWILV